MPLSSGPIAVPVNDRAAISSRRTQGWRCHTRVPVQRYQHYEHDQHHRLRLGQGLRVRSAQEQCLSRPAASLRTRTAPDVAPVIALATIRCSREEEALRELGLRAFKATGTWFVTGWASSPEKVVRLAAAEQRCLFAAAEQRRRRGRCERRRWRRQRCRRRQLRRRRRRRRNSPPRRRQSEQRCSMRTHRCRAWRPTRSMMPPRRARRGAREH